MSCCFCLKDLSIKMIYFVIFSSSLFFNVLSVFVFVTTMDPWQICNTLSFEQHKENVVSTFSQNNSMQGCFSILIHISPISIQNGKVNKSQYLNNGLALSR